MTRDLCSLQPTLWTKEMSAMTLRRSSQKCLETAILLLLHWVHTSWTCTLFMGINIRSSLPTVRCVQICNSVTGTTLLPDASISSLPVNSYERLYNDMYWVMINVCDVLNIYTTCILLLVNLSSGSAWLLTCGRPFPRCLYSVFYSAIHTCRK